MVLLYYHLMKNNIEMKKEKENKIKNGTKYKDAKD
jgi:hypothetical protein